MPKYGQFPPQKGSEGPFGMCNVSLDTDIGQLLTQSRVLLRVHYNSIIHLVYQ